MVNQSQFIEETKLWENEGTIRDLIHNTVEKAGKKYSADSKIRYIDISSVDNETNTVTGVTEYIFKDAPSRAQQCVKRGDILVSTVRPNLKNIAVNHLDGEDLVASSGFCVLRPKEGCTGLIMAYILSDVFTEKMTLVAKGTNYPAIHDSDILDYKIRLPEDSKMSMIDRLFRQADKSKFAGFKSQFISQFGNPVTNPMGWPTKPMCQVAPESPSNIKTKGRVWVLNLDMIESNSGNIINKVFEDSGDLNSVAAFDEGNVLFSKLRPYLNKVTIPDGKGYATTELVPLRPNTEELRQYFLSFLLRTDEFVKYADGIATGTKMPRMPMTALREFKCILPPTEQQDKFCGISKRADKSKYLN
jgi:restriction endonuclease S subunit